MKDNQFPYEILKDPRIFKSENCLPAHSDNVVYASAWELSRESSLRRSLNGAWKFSWSENVASAPKDFFRTDADLRGNPGTRPYANARLRRAAICEL